MAGSPTVQFSERVGTMVREGLTVHNFGGGDVTLFGMPPEAAAAGTSHFDRGQLLEPYPPVAGVRHLRGALCALMKQRTGLVFGDNLLVTPGAKQGIHLALSCIARERPGSDVIIFTPAWPTFEERVCALGLNPVFVADTAERVTDFAALEEALRSGPSAVIINSPRNPDGRVYGPPEQARILGLVHRHAPDAVVIADDVYQLNVHPGNEAVSVFRLRPASDLRIISLFSASKAFAAAGLRVGCAMGDRELLKQMRDEQGSTTGGVCTVAQSAIAAILASEQATAFPARVMTEVGHSLDRIRRWVTDTPLRLIEPQGTIYCCLDISDLIGRKVRTSAGEVCIQTAKDFSFFALEQRGVAVMFGDPFRAPHLIRLNLTQVQRSELEPGLAALAEAAHLLN